MYSAPDGWQLARVKIKRLNLNSSQCRHSSRIHVCNEWGEREIEQQREGRNNGLACELLQVGTREARGREKSRIVFEKG